MQPTPVLPPAPMPAAVLPQVPRSTPVVVRPSGNMAHVWFGKINATSDQMESVTRYVVSDKKLVTSNPDEASVAVAVAFCPGARLDIDYRQLDRPPYAGKKVYLLVLVVGTGEVQIRQDVIPWDHVVAVALDDDFIGPRWGVETVVEKVRRFGDRLTRDVGGGGGMASQFIEEPMTLPRMPYPGLEAVGALLRADCSRSGCPLTALYKCTGCERATFCTIHAKYQVTHALGCKGTAK